MEVQLRLTKAEIRFSKLKESGFYSAQQKRKKSMIKTGNCFILSETNGLIGGIQGLSFLTRTNKKLQL